MYILKNRCKNEVSGKMKVGIITFHFVNNFGGALQAYALQRIIEEEIDSEVEIIDYRNNFIRFTDMVRLFPVTKNVKEIIKGLKTFNKRIARKDKFKKFTQKNYNLSHKYSASELSKISDIDVFVCGSDQIWNPTITLGLDKTYFLGFDTTAKKIAYAPSVGIDNLSKKNRSKIEKYLSDFSAVSVRENAAVSLIELMSNQKVPQLIDPTFLLKTEDWDKVAIEPKYKKPYILLYIMQLNSDVYNYAKKMKKKYGLPIVEISRYGYKPDFVDYTLIDVGPAEFVGLFKNAAYVCTNSYHGLAFSLIYEKDFCLVPTKKYGIRMRSLLELFEIDNNDNSSLILNYDKDKVKSIIECEKTKAINFLIKNITD